MKKVMINVGTILANIIYMFIKVFPINKNKITFLSRQSNEIPLDFKLLKEELILQNKEVKIIMLCKRLEKGVKSGIRYSFHMLRQMYHIATSRVVILDSYCIPISILKHKRKLKVIQCWHALGSLKKFGYSTLGMRGGRSKEIADAMKMHKNYSYILTSSNISKPFFKEAFNAEEKQMKVMSLPRVDFLQSQEQKEKIEKEFYKVYPQCKNGKENILYCPTHRESGKVNINSVIKCTDFNAYNLIIKLHGGQEYVYTKGKKVKDKVMFKGIELLHIADYVITDYSAIVYEAAIADKPLYFYIYDYDTYMDERGWYINYKEEMPGTIEKDIKEIMKAIKLKKYDEQKIKDFKQKYIKDLTKNSTKKLAQFILNEMK